jgi:tetratricopeptide (TPR) repeat protein
LETFLSKAEKSRILPSDSGLEGLILAAIGKEKKDAAMLQQAQQKVAVAKAAKDETFDWDAELASASGTAPKVASGEGGPTNPAIEALKKQVAADPKNTDLLYKLANAYQGVQNWNGAASAWLKWQILTNWEPAYYSLGYALQKSGDARSNRCIPEIY